MRVITLNANGIRAAGRNGFFDWVAGKDADFICIQETKAQVHQLEADPLYCPEHYHCTYVDAQKKGYSGVAIYAKKQPLQIKRGLGFDLCDQEGRYLQFDYPGLSIASIYFPSGTSGEGRQVLKYEFLSKIAEHFKALKAQGKELILCGDYNIAHKKIDLKNWRGNQKNSGFLPEERAWLDELFGPMGFVDAFRHLNQEPDEYTWWSYRNKGRDKNVGWRIDYQVITPGLSAHVKHVEVYKDQCFSDHAPVIIDYSTEEAWVFKLATWNVNSLKVRLEQVLHWLKTAEPDVLCLQEIKCTDADFPLQAILDAGFHAVYSGQKTYNGVAIISKSPITHVVTDMPDFDDPQRRILAATVSGVRLINLYVPNGASPDTDKYAYKLAWLAAMTRFIQKSLHQYPNLAVLGDFNIAPCDVDVHDPKAWEGEVLVSPKEREAFQAILELGLTDAFRHVHPKAALYSWWDYRAAAFRRNHGLRIDHILLSDALLSQCVESGMDKNPREHERPSDHIPVWVGIVFAVIGG